MEPISIAASILTLIGTTTAIERGISKLWGLQIASDKIITLLNEVTDFRATLELASQAMGLLQNQDIEAVQKMQALCDRAHARLDALHILLQARLVQGGPCESMKPPSVKRAAKFRDLFGDGWKKIENHRVALLNIKMDVLLLLSAFNMHRSNPVSSSLPLSIQSIGIASPTVASHIRPSGKMEFCTREHVPLGESRLNQPVDIVSQISSIPPQSPESYVVFAGQIAEGGCAMSCYCSCHLNFRARTPPWLQGLVGSLYFQYVGTPILYGPRCEKCQVGLETHPKAASVQFQYFFPAWLFPFGISITGGWNDLRGFGATWTLKIPRALRKGKIQDEMIHTLVYGKVAEAKSFMKEHGIAAIDVNHCGVPLFECTLIYGRDDMAALLLEGGVNLATTNRYGVTLCQRAWRVLLDSPAIYEAYKNVRVAVESFSSFEVLRLNALHKILVGLSDEDLQSQIESNRTLIHGKDSENYTPLHWAAKRDNAEAVSILLQNGADPNAQCLRGISSVAYAAAWSTPEVCRMLIDAGANVNLCDDNERTSLLWALRTNPVNYDIISLLLNAGADPNNKTMDSGITCLMEAMRHPQVRICKALFDFGAEIDAADQNGWTAIFYAISSNNERAVELILSRGPDLSHRDVNGESIVEFTSRSGSISIMRLLEQANLRGLRMTMDAISNCWHIFYYQRDGSFAGIRESIQRERTALEALLESVNFGLPRNSMVGLRDNTNSEEPSFPISEPDDDDLFYDAVSTQEGNYPSTGQPWGLSKGLPSGPWASIWWAF